MVALFTVADKVPVTVAFVTVIAVRLAREVILAIAPEDKAPLRVPAVTVPVTLRLLARIVPLTDRLPPVIALDTVRLVRLLRLVILAIAPAESAPLRVPAVTVPVTLRLCASIAVVTDKVPASICDDIIRFWRLPSARLIYLTT